MTIGEFFIKLGVKTDLVGLKKLGSTIGKIVTRMGAIVTSASAAVYALKKIGDVAAKNAVSYINFNDQTGLSIKKLREWQQASRLVDSGLNKEKTLNQIKEIQKNLVNIQFGKGNTEGMLRTGIDWVGKDAFQILEEVREKMRSSKIDKATKTFLLDTLGIDPQFGRVLELSKSKFSQLAGTGQSISNSDLKKMDTMSTALERFTASIEFLMEKFAIYWAPYLTKTFNQLSAFIDKWSQFGFQKTIANPIREWINKKTGLNLTGGEDWKDTGVGGDPTVSSNWVKNKEQERQSKEYKIHQINNFNSGDLEENKKRAADDMAHHIKKTMPNFAGAR